MIEIDRAWLIVAIQAVEIAIERYEHILDSKIMKHATENDEFLYTLEETKTKLRNEYLRELEKDPGLISYERLVGQSI